MHSNSILSCISGFFFFLRQSFIILSSKFFFKFFGKKEFKSVLKSINGDPAKLTSKDLV